MRARLRRKAIRLFRQAIAVVLSAGFLLGIVGLPMVTRAPKDRSRPYPCQDRPCGCPSAEHCWRHCCCFTNKQKLVWAREHGVTPPEYVVEAAEREEHESMHACGHCAACHVAHATHEHDHSSAPESVSDPADSTGVATPANKAQLKLRLVLSDMARACGGLPSLVVVLTDALPYSERVTWTPIEVVVGYVVEAPIPSVSADLRPPVPPPKLAGAIAA